MDMNDKIPQPPHDEQRMQDTEQQNQQEQQYQPPRRLGPSGVAALFAASTLVAVLAFPLTRQPAAQVAGTRASGTQAAGTQAAAAQDDASSGCGPGGCSHDSQPAAAKTNPAAGGAAACPVSGATAADLVCPVMGNPIPSVEKAAGKSVYNGKTYYFCCTGCKPKFDKDPAAYVS